MNNIVLNDFKLHNEWVPDLAGPKWLINGQPQFLIDKSTNRRYFNEDRAVVWTKCILLSIGTPFVHAIAGVVNVFWRVMKIASLSHFWIPRGGDQGYNL